MADALSRRDEGVIGNICALSILRLSWVTELRAELATRLDLQQLIAKIKDEKALSPWEFKDEVLWYKTSCSFEEIKASRLHYIFCSQFLPRRLPNDAIPNLQRFLLARHVPADPGVCGHLPGLPTKQGKALKAD